MRRWLLVLMIALLPVRGWVGDVMAMQMAVGKSHHATTAAGATPQKAINNIAINQESTWTLATFDSKTAENDHSDCPGHAVAAPTPGDTPAGADTGHGECGACTSCQVCHSVAMAGTVDATASRALHFATPPSANAVFASALAAPGDKPPIS